MNGEWMSIWSSRLRQRVDKLFDLLDANFVHVPPHAIAMVGHLVHHLAAGLTEPEIVLEEVAVAVHVGHHELLIDQIIIRHQIRVARDRC